jgi:hypothetical protein
VFSSIFVPAEFRTLHEENFVFVLARYFHHPGLRQPLRI